MNAKELLELAAKAAGFCLVGFDDDSNALLYGIQKAWNPLIDDGDALRLAVKLGLIVSNFQNAKHDGAKVGYVISNQLDYTHENFESDPYAATRRAIVRAAAEIGRMK